MESRSKEVTFNGPPVVLVKHIKTEMHVRPFTFYLRSSDFMRRAPKRRASCKPAPAPKNKTWRIGAEAKYIFDDYWLPTIPVFYSPSHMTKHFGGIHQVHQYPNTNWITWGKAQKPMIWDVISKSFEDRWVIRMWMFKLYVAFYNILNCTDRWWRARRMHFPIEVMIAISFVQSIQSLL